MKAIENNFKIAYSKTIEFCYKKKEKILLGIFLLSICALIVNNLFKKQFKIFDKTTIFYMSLLLSSTTGLFYLKISEV